MKLIIDIPDEDYKFIKEVQLYLSVRRSGKTIERNVINAIKNGKPYEERPTGYWIEEPSKLPHCSECGTYSDDADREDGGFYCTHCGAKMEVEND